MPPEERDRAYLWDMLDAAQAALSFVDGLSKAQAIEDEMRMAAFERKLEVLGEAARRGERGFHAAAPTDTLEGSGRTAQRTRSQLR